MKKNWYFLAYHFLLKNTKLSQLSLAFANFMRRIFFSIPQNHASISDSLCHRLMDYHPSCNDYMMIDIFFPPY